MSNLALLIMLAGIFAFACVMAWLLAPVEKYRDLSRCPCCGKRKHPLP